MKCEKYLKECKAKCCLCCPLPEDLVRDNQDKIQEQPVDVWKAPSYKGVPQCLAPTPSLKCCFLKDDYTCAVYDERPEICRMFGDESNCFLSCEFQHKDGQQRSSRARQRLLKKCEKKHEKMKHKTKRFNEDVLRMNAEESNGNTAGCITVSGKERELRLS